ncbi:hypothetical protein F5146DRAFT_1068336 [Armillaria mellea]|nr:hypothetical protein F5146DRAFT_1068336 [Armillaria mellea]
MKISVTFAVSTLVPSLRSTPPMRNVYIPPPYQPEPIGLCRVWAASFGGALGGKWGSARCGMIMSFLWMSDPFLFDYAS